MIREAAEDGRDPSALTSFCSQYWTPVYAFLRGRGLPRERAEDLTQSFFAALIEKRYLQQADRSRGRFRSFLLSSLTHFVANDADHAGAQKRGGGVTHVPIDAAVEDSGMTPEQIFEKEWALTTIRSALDALRDEMREEGKEEELDRLSPYLAGDAAVPFTQLATTLGVSDGSLRVAAHRLRRRFRDALRRTIAASVANEDEIEDEIRFLIAAVGR